MNQFQSSLYLLTESVGAVSMVNVQQIVKQQNLDYLEHLCSFVDRMNLNPIWFQNEDASNKLKILEIYQMAITYSKNLALSYKKEIQQKEANLLKLRNQQKQKIKSIRDHKDDYHSMKEKYKLKKHQIYKYTYESLRNKLRQEQDERQYRRGQQSRKSSLTPQIIYYYPNQNDHMRFDPNVIPQQQHHFPVSQYPNYPPHPHPHPPQYQQNHPWPSSNNSNSNINPFPDNRPNNYMQNDQMANKNTIESSNRYNTFLDAGNLQPQQNKNIAKSTKINIKLVSQPSQQQQYKQEQMQKSQIIASGEKILQKIKQSTKNMKQEGKLASQKSQNKSKNTKKRQSSNLDSRNDDDDFGDFGDLTANSKKRDISIKQMQRNSDVQYDQHEYDSIAHIKLTTDSSNKNIPIAPPNRFQSKIHNKQEKKSEPPANIKKEQTSIGYLDSSKKDIQEFQLDLGGVMKSNLSKNKKQAEGQKLYDANNPPKRKNQQIRSSNKLQNSRKSSADQADKSNKKIKSQLVPQTNFEGEKMYNNSRPQRIKQDDSQLRSIVKTVQLSDKGVDIYHSNVGQIEKKSFQKSREQQFDLYTSNMGSGNSKASGQKILTQKPKRASQIQPNQPQLKKSNKNELKIPMAQSQQMKNSNKMLYSQATTIHFGKQVNTPPRLQKQQQKNDYEDDFEDVDLDQMLQHSRLPISHQQIKEEKVQKSQVNINIESVPTKNISKQVKQKYIKLANQTFQLKKQNNLTANNAANLLRSSNTNLAQSDDFFDQILSIPMNSKIAKRPSAIQNKFQSKIHKNVRQSQKAPSLGIIQSPSIHVIDPSGNMQKVQQRGVKSVSQSQKNLRIPNNSNKSIDEKIELNKKIQQKIKDEQEDEQIDFNLMEKSSIIDRKPQQKKVLEIINKIQTQPPVYKDSKKFDDKIFDKLIFDRFKMPPNKINNVQKWEEIQSFFKKQHEKSKIQIQQKSENASTPKHKNSFTDDLLQYSQSNVKLPNKNIKNEVKRENNIQTIKDMTESITIKDFPKMQKIQQQNNRKGSIENKYSRGSKAKAEVKNQIRKNINQGKNAYDVDDPLNVAAFQNKKLLQKKEDSDDDF